MVQTLEAIRGGGGSVKLGTTGKISVLMSREIESTNAASKVPSICTAVSASATDKAPTKLKSRASTDEASTSSGINVGSNKYPQAVRKTKHGTGRTHHIPMLAADNALFEGTPVRQKANRRGPGVVEVVDIKCRNPDKTWTNPITNRLKKLGFSKLSESIV